MQRLQKVTVKITEQREVVVRREESMGLDRRIVWIAAVVILIIALWLALDHVFFPTLPEPAGVPSIAK